MVKEIGSGNVNPSQQILQNPPPNEAPPPPPNPVGLPVEPQPPRGQVNHFTSPEGREAVEKLFGLTSDKRLGRPKDDGPRAGNAVDRFFKRYADKRDNPGNPQRPAEPEYPPPPVPITPAQRHEAVTKALQQMGTERSAQLPDFPAGGSHEEKLAFTIKLLRDFPDATRAELEARYGEFLKFAGGGQGNVVILRNTPFILKQHLEGPEKKAYEFFAAVNRFLDNPTARPIPEEIMTHFRGLTADELNRMVEAGEDIRAMFPIPHYLAGGPDANGRDNVIAVIPNASWRDGKPINESGVEDVKLGARIVSRHELKAHGNSEGSGLKWHVVKKFACRFTPWRKNTHIRGYEYIPQSSSYRVRMRDGKRSDQILMGKMEKLDDQQKLALNDQLRRLKRAHDALPVTFVGSSVMIAFPDESSPPGTMPQILMGDFAHSMFVTEDAFSRDYERDNPRNDNDPNLKGNGKQQIYTKYKENFDFGVTSLLNLGIYVRERNQP